MLQITNGSACGLAVDDTFDLSAHFSNLSGLAVVLAVNEKPSDYGPPELIATCRVTGLAVRTLSRPTIVQRRIDRRRMASVLRTLRYPSLAAEATASAT